MTLQERQIMEAGVRCEVVLSALSGLTVGLGAMTPEERVEATRLYKEASSALWKLHARFGGTT